MGSVPPLLEVIAICLAIFDDSLEQSPTHSIPSTEEAGRIGWYLCKIILHELFVAECAVPRNAHTLHSGSFSLIQQLGAVLHLLHAKQEQHHLRVVVVQQPIEVRIIGIRG